MLIRFILQALEESETKNGVLKCEWKEYCYLLLLEVKNIRYVVLTGTLNEIYPKGRIYTSALSSNCCDF